MGNATFGMDLRVDNNSKRKFRRVYTNSYQMESWPPDCFPPNIEPAKGYAGRYECRIQLNSGLVHRNDTGGDAHYEEVGNPSTTIKFHLKDFDHPCTVTCTGPIRVDTAGWKQRHSTAVVIFDLIETSAPYANMYLAGYAETPPVFHPTIGEAFERCEALRAGGVTQEGPGRFSVRNGTTLLASRDGETSWLR